MEQGIEFKSWLVIMFTTGKWLVRVKIPVFEHQVTFIGNTLLDRSIGEARYFSAMWIAYESPSAGCLTILKVHAGPDYRGTTVPDHI